jgi:hypothetical protein
MQKTILCAIVVGAAAGPTMGATDADVDRSFNPYQAAGVPQSAPRPGMVISTNNLASAKDWLDPETAKFIQDGWVTITVGGTTSFPLQENYVRATRQGLNKVHLGTKPGEIIGYQGGRPFPEEPSAADARAGEKLAWNFRYGVNYGDTGMVKPFYWKYKDLTTSKVDRTLSFEFYFLNYKHRVVQPPIPEITPNLSQFYRGTYGRVLEPLDVKNTQLLIHRYEDDTKLDDVYLYLGFQRRVRRLASGQTTDAFLGSELMVEDFEGYNGRISDMQWTYKGSAYVLLPFYNHNEQKLSDEQKDTDGFRFTGFHGKGNCFPDATWQLRKAYIIEAVPVDSAHPVSKRVYYMDAQTAAFARVNIYDRKQELWKSLFIGKSNPDSHLPVNKGSGVPLDDAVGMIDVQTKRCTTLHFKVQIDPSQIPQSLFTVQHLRGD